MSPQQVGHRRTGRCPTFEEPTLQRDGYLLRIPLVGGALTPVQLRAVADASERHGSGLVELTNRGNLQVRGIAEASLAAAGDRLRDAGLGRWDASLVSISPFASTADHGLRERLIDALAPQGTPPEGLSPKFVVHVDDALGLTASRRAEAMLRPTSVGCELRLGGDPTTTTSDAEAVERVAALAAACRAGGPEARLADIGWPLVTPEVAEPVPVPVGCTTNALGTFTALGSRHGRVLAGVLASLAGLVEQLDLERVAVTPWRSIVLATGDDSVIDAAQRLGFAVEPDDPRVRIVACIGALGCWQTELDTQAEAARLSSVDLGVAPEVLVHVSGCDKRCATKQAGLTFLGRNDSSGFDRRAGTGA